MTGRCSRGGRATLRLPPRWRSGAYPRGLFAAASDCGPIDAGLVRGCVRAGVRRRARQALKICIVSDSHDRADPLLAAAQAAARAGASALVHCGDVIGANTLRPLDALGALGMAVHVVHGNNLGDALALARMAEASGGWLHYHGGEAELTLAGRRVYVTHYPHQAQGMACTADYDLVCCGHTHVAALVQQPNIRGQRTWLVNPGTVAGIGGPPTWVLGDLERMSFETCTLPS